MSRDLQHSLSLSYLEDLLEAFSNDPSSVPDDWREYFDSLTNGARFQTTPSFAAPPLFRSLETTAPQQPQQKRALEEGALPHAELQAKVDEVVRTFRIRGHLAARINPLHDPPHHAELELEAFGLDREDLQKEVATAHIPGPKVQTAGQVYARMRNTYCHTIGAEFMHIDNLEVRGWLQERMEVTENRATLEPEAQRRILRSLTAASLFESFIQKKYLGAKSFSLEGAESLIPLLDLTIEKAGSQGCREIVFGMAHRGRLNVLCNILNKPAQEIFREFEDKTPEDYRGRGDVKYHLGHSSDWMTGSGQNVHLSMAFNPSHLEFINPVAMGRVRAKQDRFGDDQQEGGMVLLIHGDAAFAGEGVVQETLNLSQLPPYAVGGAVHVIVNNQVGFTTSPHEARSTRYATDVAKMLQIPIFHVNGEDPEAVAQVVDLAMDFRRAYKRDVVVDMYCYRRRGHNEGDEPAFTQPLLYQEIRARRPVHHHYLEHLLQLGGLTREEAEELVQQEETRLEDELKSARGKADKKSPQAYEGIWKPYHGGRESESPEADTGITVAESTQILESLATIPEDFRPLRKIQRFLNQRREMASGQQALDWSAGEALAFASLAKAGHPVRLTGQDCQRGTFSHRHAVLHDENDGRPYMPLAHLDAEQAPVQIHNSPLSEAGVLGFEYGYSLDTPEGLVMWEAQFGDFVNTAQVVIDQFMTSAEDKWNRLSGIVLLLPHGFEGQGPEHSSARLERWLTLCAEDNIQVANPTTPAQYFHLLRRQVLRPLRKPLIVMTPKSLLRHPHAVSSLDDLVKRTFQRVLLDQQIAAETTERILLCSGKIYYELEEFRREHGRKDVAILRLEQLYPLPYEQLEAALLPYPADAPIIWVQEEPRNMGAWPHLRLNFGDRLLNRDLYGVHRDESASPATGSATSHRIEQADLLTEAFGLTS